MLEIIDHETNTLRSIDLNHKKDTSAVVAMSSYSYNSAIAKLMHNTDQIDSTLNALLLSNGTVRVFESSFSSLEAAKNSWESMLGRQVQSHDSVSKPKYGVNQPKHG